MNDVEKVYGIEPHEIHRLKNKLIFPKKEKVKKRTKKNLIKISVNSASRDQWQKLRGIGPVLSERICKFRDKLGGFHSLSQVGETYGLADSTFSKILPFLTLSGNIRKIPINESSIETLRAHPYISYKAAKLLKKFIEQNGPVNSEEMLLSSFAFKEDELQKILPYMDFTNGQSKIYEGTAE